MRRVLLASLNTAVERLLVCDHVTLGAVHTLSEDFTMAGGKGINSARILAQLAERGAATEPLVGHLIGLIGGTTGVLVAEALAVEQLTGTWIESNAPTRVNEILVDRSNSTGATVFNAKGIRVSEATWVRLDEAFRLDLETSVGIVCSGSIPPGIPEDCYGQWIESARLRGRWSLLDSHGEPLLRAARQGPTIIKINRDELVELSPDTTATIRAWKAVGTLAVIVTDGGNPVLVSTPVGDFELIPPKLAVVSAVGSGDAFSAGLLFELERTGWKDWDSALRRAVACGAANAMSLRAKLADHADLDALSRSTVITSTPSITSTRSKK